MNERSFSVPVWSLDGENRHQPHDVVVSAISDLADHVRAYGLNQADDLLTELLALLHAEQDRAGQSSRSARVEDRRSGP